MENINKELEALKSVDARIIGAINELKKTSPCREVSIVITKLEESSMWIYKRYKDLQNGD